MLNWISAEEEVVVEERGKLLRPSYYVQLLKRRWAFILLPFLCVSGLGLAFAMLAPPTYYSEGKVIVQSQQIPTELVRPTVTTAAQERLQVIQQRTMTRDDLLSIIEKFNLYAEKRPTLATSELVELMRRSIKIATIEMPLEFGQRARAENPTVVFSVGFEYTDAKVAADVTKELIGQMIAEDVRDRTSRAADTTKFLAVQYQKLETENAAIDAKIAEAKSSLRKPSNGSGGDQQGVLLNQLRDELAQKSALYSDQHPILQALKRQIKSLESATAPKKPSGEDAEVGLDALLAQQELARKSLETASAKYSAAQAGENLEKMRQSEKLDILEQPTVPQRSVRPNRLKLVASAIIAGLIAGIVLAYLTEVLDYRIRASTDISNIVDQQLVISIPYISTHSERRARRANMFFASFAGVLVLAGLFAARETVIPHAASMLTRAQTSLLQ